MRTFFALYATAALLTAAGLIAAAGAQDKDKSKKKDEDTKTKLGPSFLAKIDRVAPSTATIFLGGAGTQGDRERAVEKDRAQKDRELKDRGATDRDREFPSPNRVRAVRLSKDAKVSLDGREANLSDLRAGHIVRVYLRSGGEDPVADRVEAFTKLPPAKDKARREK